MQDRFKILVNDDYKMVGIAPITNTLDSLELAILHDDEKREFELINNATYRKQWMTARWLAFHCKQMIKKEKVKDIYKNESGRPYLKESSLHVSLSHNKNIAAVMFSTESCGIDVELFREKIFAIENKFLTPLEIEKHSGDLIALTLIWSAKESIYKMLGIPGLIFREQINCQIENISNQGIFSSEIMLKSKMKKIISVNYQLFEKELITYCQLGNSI